MFRPDPLRYYACYLCLLVFVGLILVVPLIFLLALLSMGKMRIEPVLPEAGVLIVLLAVVEWFSLSHQLPGMSITISDKHIAGPSLWVNQPVQFSLKNLDKEKSFRQNFFQRILGYRLIVSTSGKKILFLERAFDKRPATEILKTISDADKIAA